MFFRHCCGMLCLDLSVIARIMCFSDYCSCPTVTVPWSLLMSVSVVAQFIICLSHCQYFFPASTIFPSRVKVRRMPNPTKQTTKKAKMPANTLRAECYSYHSSLQKSHFILLSKEESGWTKTKKPLSPKNYPKNLFGSEDTRSIQRA